MGSTAALQALDGKVGLLKVGSRQAESSGWLRSACGDDVEGLAAQELAVLEADFDAGGAGLEGDEAGVRPGAKAVLAATVEGQQHRCEMLAVAAPFVADRICPPGRGEDGSPEPGLGTSREDLDRVDGEVAAHLRAQHWAVEVEGNRRDGVASDPGQGDAQK